MKFISLFSGVGGFDLGFEQAGMECVLQVEKDKFANQVLKKRWPRISKMEDVHDLNKQNAPTADLICGGFPCQDVSVAGRRAGLAGKRSGLWYEFARIIGDIRPRWVVIENVPGLLSSGTDESGAPFKGRDMAIITGALAELGYWWAYRILDSQYFGVAQRRRRVFIVANATDGTAPAKVLFESESGERHTPPSRETGQTSPPLTASGVGAGRTGNERNELDFAIPDVARAITTGEGLRQKVDQDNFMVFPIKTDQQKNSKNEGEASFTLGSSGTAIAFHNRQDPDISGEVTHPLGSKDNGMGVVAACPKQQITSKENQSRVKEDSPVPTLNQAGQMHVGVRRLTPLECERLQAFPDRWTAEGAEGPISDTQRYGNAVTVSVAEWIGQRIMQIEMEAPAKRIR